METFMTMASNIFEFWQEMLLWILGFLVGFWVLYRFTPCNPKQRFQHRAFATDMAYYFIMPIFGRMISAIYTGLGILIFFRGVPDDQIMQSLNTGYGPLGQMPVWLQAAVIFIVSDIILYWTHRLFHTPGLWPYHAIHHSPKHVDWHSTYRFHPVNVWLTFTLVDSCMMFAGFSIEAVTLMSVFNLLYSAMVHANLNWTFGPFRYAFSSPVFHRWHHTTQKEGLDKNFAPTFPLLDIVFGTFYMPEGKMPEIYGNGDDHFPESFVGQMLYPFKNRKKD